MRERAGVLINLITPETGSSLVLCRYGLNEGNADQQKYPTRLVETPGGKVDDTDSTVFAAARRETVEETGFDLEYAYVTRLYTSMQHIASGPCLFNLYGANVELPFRSIDDARPSLDAMFDQRSSDEFVSYLLVEPLELVESVELRESMTSNFLREISLGTTRETFHRGLRAMGIEV